MGTSMMEAALVAASIKGRPLTFEQLHAVIAELDLKPSVQELTPTAQPVG